MKTEAILGGLSIVLFILVTFYFTQNYYQTFSGPPNAQVASTISLTPVTVAQHNTASDCWLIISNNVYTLTKFLPLHPGGTEIIIPYCGKDATQAFMTQAGMGSHSSFAKQELNSLLIGQLNTTISAEQINAIQTRPIPPIDSAEIE